MASESVLQFVRVHVDMTTEIKGDLTEYRVPPTELVYVYVRLAALDGEMFHEYDIRYPDGRHVAFEDFEFDDELDEINDGERQAVINNSNECKRLISDIMFTVENNREKFKDGEFLELCNNLMQLNNKV